MVRDREGALLALLRVMAETDGPVGTRSAAAALLRDLGLRVSESSTSRMLRELDERGWTQPQGAKGRVLSAEGRRHHEEATLVAGARDAGSRTIHVRDVNDVLELLEARRGIESSVAASVAGRLTPEDLERLDALLLDQVSDVPGVGIEFHRSIAALSPNATLRTLADVVLAPHLSSVEAVLDIIIGTHHQESSVVDQHRAVLAALAGGDATEAENIMRGHFDSMIVEAKRYLGGQNASIVARLLEYMGKPAVGG